MSIRRNAMVCTLGLVVIAGCGGDQPVVEERADVAPAPPSFTPRVVATGLGFPWEVIWGPDDHLWVTERAGKRIIRCCSVIQ